jgi:hypothetical protein
MRISLPTPPFDCEGLTSSFGFRVPSPFVTLLQDCGSAEAADERAAKTLGLRLTGDDARYQDTPPELFPIATTGFDGNHYGYVIHAPELATSDFPIAGFEPIAHEGAFLLGTSTFEAVETLLSTRIILYEQSPLSYEWWPEVSTRLRRLGIEPTLAKAVRHFDCRPVVPTVPEGWRHVPSSDGVGVLAPATEFHPTSLHSMEERPDVGSVLDAASKHVFHFPATALWLLRECYWHTWTALDNDTFALCDAMIDCYNSLNQLSLAAVVDRRIASL